MVSLSRLPNFFRRFKKKRYFLGAIIGLLLGCFLFVYLPARCAENTQHLQDVAIAPSSPDLVKGIKIGAFNMAHGRGAATSGSNWGGTAQQRREHLQQIRKFLKQQQVDILILNEVDFDCSWSHRQHQAQIIAKAVYRNQVTQTNYQAALPGVRWQFGNAILSSYEIISHQFIDLVPQYGYEELVYGDKNVLLVEFKNTQGQRFDVIAVHLESRDEPTRLKAAQKLIQITKQSDHPIILAGDFNSTLQDYPGHQTTPSGQSALDLLLASQLFQPAFSNTFTPTFPNNAPSRQIDWILIPKHWHARSSQSIQTNLSDHTFISATVGCE